MAASSFHATQSIKNGDQPLPPDAPIAMVSPHVNREASVIVL